MYYCFQWVIFRNTKGLWKWVVSSSSRHVFGTTCTLVTYISPSWGEYPAHSSTHPSWETKPQNISPHAFGTLLALETSLRIIILKMITFSVSKITSLEASQFLPLRLFSFLHTHVFFLTYLSPSFFFNSPIYFILSHLSVLLLHLNPSVKRKGPIPPICVHVPKETLVWDLIKGCLS